MRPTDLFVALRSDTGEDWHACDPPSLLAWVPVAEADDFREARSRPPGGGSIHPPSREEGDA